MTNAEEVLAMARYQDEQKRAAEMQLQMAIEAAEQFMTKAPYLCYDHAKNLIAAAKRVLEAKDDVEHQP